MQEINLLQNKLKDKTNELDKNNRTVLIGSAILMLLVIAAGVVFQTMTKGTMGKTAKLEQENTTIQSSLDQQESVLATARGFQAQTKNITTLLNNHVIWTNLMNDLAASAYVTSRSLRMNSDTTGKIKIEGLTPTYTDLGKVLLGLETSDSLESVRLITTTKSTEIDSGLHYSIELQAKTTALTAD